MTTLHFHRECLIYWCIFNVQKAEPVLFKQALMNDRVNTVSFQILNTFRVLKMAEFAQK